MWGNLPFRRGTWTIADQLVVSGGAFLVNVLLARQLPAAEYGAFAVLLGVMLTLQLVNASLLFQPLAVRLAGAVGAAERALLLRATLALAAVLSAALGASLVPVLCVLGRVELVAPALCCFLAWQVQEAARRSMLAMFRHRTACLGDAISYLGQAAIVACLAAGEALTLAGALYTMAATSAAAAAVQCGQLRLGWGGPLPLRKTAADYWSISGAWSLTNGVLSQLRGQVLAWVIAIEGGLAMAAAFQAAVNVINMSNPLLISLGNVIPQTAAQASRLGNAHAWRASRAYAYLALPLFSGYAAVVLAAPQTILLVFYGADSGYADLAPVLRLLVAGALIGYAADVVVSFLHGIVALRAATLISAAGALTAAALSPVLVGQFGLYGGCFVVVAANAARFATAYLVMARITASTGGLLPAPAGAGPLARE